MYGTLEDAVLLQSELARVVGAEHAFVPPEGRGESDERARSRLSPYDHDATRSRGLHGRADLVVRPGSTAEVAAVVALCYERDVPPDPARRRHAASRAARCRSTGGVVCSLERMRAIRELEPALWRIHPEAGVRHAPRAAPRARERTLLPARPGGRRAVADRRQRRDQRRRARTPSSTASPATGSPGLEAVVPPAS